MNLNYYDHLSPNTFPKSMLTEEIIWDTPPGLLSSICLVLEMKHIDFKEIQ